MSLVEHRCDVCADRKKPARHPLAITFCSGHPGEEEIGSRTREELRAYVASLGAEPAF